MKCASELKIGSTRTSKHVNKSCGITKGNVDIMLQNKDREEIIIQAWI